jgi:hypothetical protein
VWCRAKEVPSVSAPAAEEELAVNTDDLKHLRRVVQEKDGGPAWIHMMDRTLPTFRYQAWRRDMEVRILFSYYTLQTFSSQLYTSLQLLL